MRLSNVDVPVVPLDPVQIKERVMIEVEKRNGDTHPTPCDCALATYGVNALL